MDKIITVLGYKNFITEMSDAPGCYSCIEVNDKHRICPLIVMVQNLEYFGLCRNKNSQLICDVTPTSRILSDPPNYVTTATPTLWGKPLWFVNKNDFGVVLHFFEICKQFCIDKKLLPKKCVKTRYYLHSLYCNYRETCINHYVTLPKHLKCRSFSVQGTQI